MPDLVKLYHRLPYGLRVAAATAHGARLRWWRYGPGAERLVEEALARETWSPERWRAWQEERLAYTLHRAATQVPYYRAHWEERRRRGDRASWELLAHWPVLSKEALREHPHAFLADSCDARRMYREHTSGTTGKPLNLWWSRQTVQAWYALFEARWRRWNGLSRHDRWAILGGRLVVPVDRSRPPFWVWNAALNQLYLSSYHLAPEHIPAYIEALHRHRVEYLWGYASALYTLAQNVLREGLTVPPLRAALSNAEPLYPYQRAAIQAAFQCPVKDTYGMAEIVSAASECACGALHLWPEVGLLEVWDPEHDTPLPAGEAGRLVGTGLLNLDMPLIRYDIGDRGVVEPEGTACACGRTLPLLRQVDGRADDVILTADGRRIGRLDPVFKQTFPIYEAQIIQEQLDRLRVKLVPAPGFDAGQEDALVERLQQYVGRQMEIVIERVSHIPRTSSGKFRAVISHIAQQAHEAPSVQPALRP